MNLQSTHPVRVAYAGLTSGMPTRFSQRFEKNHQEEIVQIAVWDYDPVQAEEFSQGNNIKHACPRLEELFDHADAIFCDLKNAENEHLVIDALSRGIMVFVSKPLAHNLDASVRMLLAADKSGSPMFSCSPFRCHPGISDLAQRWQSGALGLALSCHVWAVHEVHGYLSSHTDGKQDQRWRFDPQVGGMPLIDLGIHASDILVSVMGETARRVRAIGRKRWYPDESFHDTHAIEVEHEDGLISTMAITHGCKHYAHGIDLAAREERVWVECHEGADVFDHNAKMIVEAWQQQCSPVSAREMFASMALLEAAKQAVISGQWKNVASSSQRGLA